MIDSPKIAVVGLGYVGLPLAAALSRHFSVIGMDANTERIAELRRGFDRTGEITQQTLKQLPLSYTGQTGYLSDCNIYIVTVPTPVDADNAPDLTAVKQASTAVGSVLRSGDVVVYESTVYLGVTENICAPLLEAASGLKVGKDFFLGYSPERINPGDPVHKVDRITKVVAGQNAETTALLTRIYGAINGGNIFAARDIRTAEASKTIENAQRDINIAFINEIALIFDRIGLSVHDVLATARTKWNFLPFQPGLVGGHCVSVDPHYLAYTARETGVEPEVILAGRRINDRMATEIAIRIAAMLSKTARILVLGITFKENVPDIRNSKVADLVKELRRAGHQVAVFDPLADRQETKAEYDVALLDKPHGEYDCVIGAVAHDDIVALQPATLLKPGGLVADVKNIWRRQDIPPTVRYWGL